MNPQTRHPLADPDIFGVIVGGLSPEELGMMPNKKGAARRLRLNFTYTLSMARCAGKMGHGFGLYFPIGMRRVAEIGE